MSSNGNVSEHSRDQPGLPRQTNSRKSQSLGRGLTILHCFTPDTPVLGVVEIARQLGLNQSTAHRYVTTLAALGYLEQNRSRKYRLGLSVVDLGHSALSSTPLPELALPLLRQLREATGYTASLGVLDGADVVVTQRSVSTRRSSRLIPERSVGARLPGYSTSLGKVLLASIPDGDWKSRLGSGRLRKHGPNTIISRKRLAGHLREVRERGVATSYEELLPDVLSIAVPVFEEQGEVTAAIGLTAHRSATTVDVLARVATAQLKSGASRLSEQLGYRIHDRSAAS